MSSPEVKIPFMFRGTSRFYRVVGVQDTTVYGLNIDVSVTHTKKLMLTLALACLNEPPGDTPFTVRAASNFLVSFEECPPDGTPALVHNGYRLNKLTVMLGEKLSSFEASDYLLTQIPALKHWLDVTLDNAGIMPVFNESGEVFKYFFGESVGSQAVYHPFELAPITGKAANPGLFDFSKYGLPVPAPVPDNENPSLTAAYTEYVNECVSDGTEDCFEFADWLNHFHNKKAAAPAAVKVAKVKKLKHDTPPKAMPGEEPQ